MIVRCLVAAAFVVLGCSRSPAGQRSTPSPAATASPADAPAHSAPWGASAANRPAPDQRVAGGGEAPADTATRELLALADRLVAAVARVRQLEVRRPVLRGVLGRGDIVARLRSRVRREYGEGEIEREGLLYERLGMLPPGYAYERELFDLFEEQVAGFYDPDERRLFIASWVGGAAQAMTLTHEITHALQDQHFDIGRFTHHRRGGGDTQLAAMAIVEGDAMLAMAETLLSFQSRSLLTGEFDAHPSAETSTGGAGAMVPAGGGDRLRRAPRAIRESMLLPYTAGYDLCLRSYRAHRDFSQIDGWLRTPPVSTEQILHEERRRANDAPVDVPATPPPSLARTYVVSFDDVMGEFGLRLALAESLPAPIAASAAAGWGGDRAMLLTPRGQPASSRDVIVWELVFDTRASGAATGEAEEFFRAALEWLRAKYPRAARRAPDPTTRVFEVAPGRVALLMRQGLRVRIIDGAPEDLANEMIAEFAPRVTGRSR